MAPRKSTAAADGAAGGGAHTREWRNNRIKIMADVKAGMPMTVFLRELHVRGTKKGLPMHSIFGQRSLSAFCRSPCLLDNDMATFFIQEKPKSMPYEFHVHDTKDLLYKPYSFFDDPTTAPVPAAGIASSFGGWLSASPSDCMYAMEETTHTPRGALVVPLPLHVKAALAGSLPAIPEVYWRTDDAQSTAGLAAAAAPVAPATAGATLVRPVPPDEPGPRPEDPNGQVGSDFAALVVGPAAGEFELGFDVDYADPDTIVRFLTIVDPLGSSCDEYPNVEAFQTAASADECEAVLTVLFPDDLLLSDTFDPLSDFDESDVAAGGDELALSRARAAHHLAAAVQYFAEAHASYLELLRQYPGDLARIERLEDRYVKEVQLWEAKIKVYDRQALASSAPAGAGVATTAKLGEAKLRALLAHGAPDDLGALLKTHTASLDKLVDRASTTRAVPGSGDIGALPALSPLLLPGDCQVGLRDYITANVALVELQADMLLELGSYGTRLLALYDSRGPDIAKHLLPSSLARVTNIVNFAGILAASVCNGMLAFSYDITFELLTADIAVGSVPIVGDTPKFGPLVKDLEGLALALIDLGVASNPRQENALRLKILSYLGYPGKGSSDMAGLDVTIKQLLETECTLARRHSKDCMSIADLTTVLDDYFKQHADSDELLNAYSHQFSYGDEPVDLDAGAIDGGGGGNSGGGGGGGGKPNGGPGSATEICVPSCFADGCDGTATRVKNGVTTSFPCTRAHATAFTVDNTSAPQRKYLIRVLSLYQQPQAVDFSKVGAVVAWGGLSAPLQHATRRAGMDTAWGSDLDFKALTAGQQRAVDLKFPSSSADSSSAAPTTASSSSSSGSTAASSLSSLSNSTSASATNLSKRLDMNMSCTVDDEVITYQRAHDILLNPATTALSPTDFEQLEQAKQDLPETMYCMRLETAFAKRYLGIQL